MKSQDKGDTLNKRIKLSIMVKLVNSAVESFKSDYVSENYGQISERSQRHIQTQFEPAVMQ